MKTVLLAGGLGTRLAEETRQIPKPMVEIGGIPILWHIMGTYASHGFKEFVVALGYKSRVIKEFFLHHYHYANDLSIELGSGKVTVESGLAEKDWTVHLVETGEDTMTGGRLARLAGWVEEDTFMMTYGDGVADVDVTALVEFHKSHGRGATITIVRPPARFGSVATDGDRVERFLEKPQIGEGWINGGFFVLEPRVLGFIDGDETSWEREPLERLAEAGELMAYRHEGFWQPMDTLRDKRMLEELYSAGKAPWITDRP